jgi:hypothetical protein
MLFGSMHRTGKSRLFAARRNKPAMEMHAFSKTKITKVRCLRDQNPLRASPMTLATRCYNCFIGVTPFFHSTRHDGWTAINQVIHTHRNVVSLNLIHSPLRSPILVSGSALSLRSPGGIRIKHAKAPAIHCVGRNGVQWPVLACRRVPVGTDQFLEDLHWSHAHNLRRYGWTL